MQRHNGGGDRYTPDVYAIELLEFPKDIPIAKLSVAATSSLSSIFILSERALIYRSLVKGDGRSASS